MKGRKPPGKWIEGLRPDMPAPDAAREVLEIRLQAVELMLPLADRRAGEDVEYIHQLRVATRRADAAVRQFGPCLKDRRRRKIRRRLRRIRQAAGIARECDVHRSILVKLRKAADGSRRAVLDELIAWTDDQRARAQHAVHDVAKRYPVRTLARKRERMTETLRHPADLGRRATFRTLALATLPPLADDLLSAAAADLSVLDNLHALRLHAKRLRYAAEVFAPCFGDDFQPFYAVISSLQEVLGDINDSYEMIARIDAFRADRADSTRGANGQPAQPVEELRASFQDQLDRGVADFLDGLQAGKWSKLRDLTRVVRPDSDREVGGSPRPDRVPAAECDHDEGAPV